MTPNRLRILTKMIRGSKEIAKPLKAVLVTEEIRTVPALSCDGHYNTKVYYPYFEKKNKTIL